MTKAAKQVQLHTEAAVLCQRIDLLTKEIQKQTDGYFLERLTKMKSKATSEYSDILDQITAPLKLVS